MWINNSIMRKLFITVFSVCVLMFGNFVNTASAETSVVQNSPNIVNTDQSSSSFASNSSKASESISQGAKSLDGAGEKIAGKITNSSKGLGESNSQSAIGLGKQARKQLDFGTQNMTKPTEFKDSTGQGITGLYQRVDQTMETLGGGLISVLLKGLYYLSNILIAVSFIMVLLSFFVKKIAFTKWLISLISSILILGIFMWVFQINILDLPFIGFIKWIFTG